MRRTRAPKKDPVITILRWKGKDIRYNEGDRPFVHEAIAHELGFKNAAIVMVQPTTDPKTYQSVILDIDNRADHDDATLVELIDNAKPEQHCFYMEYKTEAYEALTKKRNSQVKPHNVFDLFMGYEPPEVEEQPDPEGPTTA